MEENKRKFKLFDMNRDGRGVEVGEDNLPRNFRNFFKFFGRKFNKLLSVNLMMVFLILPAIAAIFVYMLGPTMSTPQNVIFPVAYSTATLLENPAADLLLSVCSLQYAQPAIGSYVYYVLGGIAFFYLITFGWQMVGGTYLLRGLVRGDPVFIITDYFYAIKKNLKQALLVGILDFLLIAALVIDFIYFYNQTSSYFLDVMYIAIIALIFIYCMMRPYIYLQLITFNLKTFKILKNALIFTVLGIKRNLMAALGIAFIIALNILLIVIFSPLNIIVPLVLPLFYFLAVSGFITTYAAYPVIEKYMIENEG